MRKKEFEKRYFDSWRTHDWELLRSITDPEVSYEIHGKKNHNGHEELETYWNRNADRQSDLSVFSHLVDCGEDWSTHNFYARFFNKVKQQYQVVFGYLTFHFDGDGKISKLYENYSKIPETPPSGTLSWRISIGEWLEAVAKKNAVPKFFRLLISLVVAFFYIATIAVAILFFLFEMTDQSSFIASLTLSEFWSNLEIEDSVLKSRIESLEKIFLWVLSSSTISYFLLEKLSQAFSRRDTFKKHKLVDRNRDAARLMARYLTDARKVSVFSGDFDFFENDASLLDVFRFLESRGELSFFSERSVDEVTKSISSLPRTNDLIRRLKNTGRMFFDSNLKSARATYFEKDGIAQVLNLPDSKTFVVLSGIDENEATIKIFKGLLQEKMDRGDPNEQLDPKAPRNMPLAVFVCGSTGAGKTTISREISKLGFKTISVSETMKELSDEPLSTRIKLIDFGKKLMSENQGEELFSALEKKITTGNHVVVDGLRPVGMIQKFREKFGQDVFIIYVVTERNELTRRVKHELEGNQNRTGLTPTKIRNSDDFFGVEEISKFADEIIAGNADLDKSIAKIRRSITLSNN